MTRKKDKGSPSKSDTAALPSLASEAGSSQDQAGGELARNDNDTGGQADHLDILNRTQDLALTHELPIIHQSPTGHDAAAHETKSQRSASVQAAEAAKRRENNFLEKLWNWLDSDVSHGIMEFSVNGRYLLILDPDAVPEALDAANICKHKNYGSFQRQCCIYGWRRIPQIEVPKLVLDDDEEPGATISRLGDTIKVMQHENLLRDSPREEVRSVTRKAKPKPSRAKDAESRAIANERMAAEQAEREERQRKQAELVALHRMEEKQRQDEQRRREQIKQQQEEDQVNMDLTYDPALPPAPPMTSNIVLDPSLTGLTASTPVPTNTLGATPTISKQANSNTITTTKKAKGTSKKRKAASGGVNDKGENQENIYDSSHNNGDIRVNEEMAKRAKRKQDATPNPSTTVTFDNDAVLSSLGMNNDPFATMTLDHHISTESATANFDNFFANAFDPSQFTSAAPTLPTTTTMSSTQQMNSLAPAGTQFEALPKSLQEAFLTLDKNNNTEQNNDSNASSSSTTPSNVNSVAANQANSMIDPALTGSNGFDSSSLPPLPPTTASSQANQSYANTPNISNNTPVTQTQSVSSTNSNAFSGLGGMNVNYGAGTSLSSSASLPSAHSNINAMSSMAAPFYYQPSSIDAFSDPTYDPNLPPNNVLPPYFSSAFSGLADLQATNW